MINTTITFYNVGLSDKNLAYDWDALNRILAAGLITDNGQAYELHLTALPFGQVFNISQDVYDIVKTATYILIENTDPEKPNATPDARGCFINNFLQLANGNWSVSYTIDDWASYYLNPYSPYNIHIDGFTERANVPLIKEVTGNVGKFTAELPLTEEQAENGTIKINKVLGQKVQGRTLPDGYFCAVYFIEQPRIKGNPIDATAHGTVLDVDSITGNVRQIDRLNSNLYFAIYNNNGMNCRLSAVINTDPGNIIEVQKANVYHYTQVDDSSIQKIMYFTFLPANDTYYTLENNGEIRLHLPDNSWTSEFSILFTCADIIHVDEYKIGPGQSSKYGWYFGLKIENWTPAESCLISTIIKGQNSPFIKSNVINDYYNNSLYQYIDEARKVTIRYLTAEITIPVQFLHETASIFMTFSGDGETVILKYIDPDLPSILKSNKNAANGQNIDFFDLVHVRDYKAYKNAKITGAAGIAASTIGSIVGFATSTASVAKGNIAGVSGMVGAISGGATGLISNIQKLQRLTPMQQSPANGDKTLTDMLKDVPAIDCCFYIEEITDAPATYQNKIKYLEENGAGVAMAFNEYIDKCQMQAFNAIKMSVIDVTGAPQQICRRIEETFLSGVTLWTSTDVGNKRVINYPLISLPV